jgi:hypothetical protein
MPCVVQFAIFPGESRALDDAEFSPCLTVGQRDGTHASDHLYHLR